MILATCASLAAVLVSLKAGGSVQLSGSCDRIQIARVFPARVTIDATRAQVRGLALSGQNITWRGGTLSASHGAGGNGPNGYAVRITGRGIVLEDALITGSRMGLVVFEAADITVRNNRFWRVRSDGINASRTTGLRIQKNSFSEFQPRPGDHADAVQLRDGVVDALIERNSVSGDAQGIGQMDTKGDKPLERIVVRGNTIRVTAYHTVTLGECRDCRIENNDVTRGRSDRKAVIRAGLAKRCGNRTTDERSDGRCK